MSSLWPRGRPPKYSKEFCVDLLNKMAEGQFNSWICASWDIAENTFYTWLKDHPEFKEVYEVGLPKRQMWWEKFGVKLMKGEADPKGQTTYMMFMNKQFKYREESSQNMAQHTINIGNMNVLSLDQKDIDSEISKMLNNQGITNGINGITKEISFDGTRSEEEAS